MNTLAEVDLGKNANGNLIGTVTSGPDRLVFPLMKIAANGRHVAFFARTNQPFEGGGLMLYLVGRWNQRGTSLPLTITRSDTEGAR